MRRFDARPGSSCAFVVFPICNSCAMLLQVTDVAVTACAIWLHLGSPGHPKALWTGQRRAAHHDSLSHVLACGGLCSHIPVPAKKPIFHPALPCWHHLEREPNPIPCRMEACPCSAKHADSIVLRAQPVLNVVLTPLDTFECEEALRKAGPKLGGRCCHLICLLVC